MKLCCKIFIIAALLIQASGYCQTDSIQVDVEAQADTMNVTRLPQAPINIKFPSNYNHIIPALNYKDADLRDVIRSIAYEYKTNVVIDNALNMRTSIALFNIELMSALRIIAEDNGLEFSFDENRFFIKQKLRLPPPAPPTPETRLVVNYAKGKLELDLKNADLNLLIDELRKKTNKNYMASNGLAGRLTGSLKSMALTPALNHIFRNNGFAIWQKDSIYYIARDYSPSNAEGAANNNGYWVMASDDMISIRVIDADLSRVVDDISTQLNLPLIKLAPMSAKVTLKCEQVSLERAFEYLFMGTEFTYKKSGGAYIVGTKASKNLDVTKLIPLTYLRADKVKEKLPPNIIQGAGVSVSIEHNALIVSGSKDAILSVESFIEEIDKPVPQVLIEALVVDYNLDKSLELGLHAGRGDSTYTNRADSYFPGIDITASGSKINKLLNDVGSVNAFGKEHNVAKLGKLPDDFYVNLRAMQSSGIANIKSRPILSTLNGHTASLKIGTVQNYVFTDIMPISNVTSTSYIEQEKIEKIEASISFEITPWVGPNNELTLEIKPDFQTPVGQFVPDKKQIPAINTRTFSSTVRLRDGETIVLGGLIQETENNDESKIPFLGDIPFFGKFFTNTTKSTGKGELIIYLTPRISYGDDFGKLYFDYSE